jgi:DNA-binding response OmpR family regulator
MPVPHAKRLLIVEDDADLAENLAEILEGMGHDPVVAGTAERALELLGQETIDGVITDFRLPGLGGVELISKLRAAGRVVPVVVISAFMDDGMAAQAEEAGALDVLPKPVDLDRLGQLLDAFSRPEGQVLIVEDNESLAENIAEALRDSGLVAAIGADAESAFANRSLPRVAIVDLRLPDKDGVEVARRLCARDPTIKIIFVTAYGEELRDRLEQAVASLQGVKGHVPLVTKPFDLAELVACVRDAVAEHP